MPADYPLVTGSEHWRRKVRTVFKCLDSNADGYITREDWVIGVRRFVQYLNIDDEKAERILNERLAVWKSLVKDSEDDTTAKISVEEYVQHSLSFVNWVNYRQELQVKLISTTFNGMDVDGDGLISKEEHAAFFYGIHVPVEHSKDVFNVMDADKDGFISLAEYAEAHMEFWLTEDPENKYNEFFGPLVD
ncbi:sarcoplasmic calcium-binding protein 1-like [Lingula anatina]|uniref:Sarcoplasmic calcium-binding protein 1-like n=1 Tax=Lingula anatina TaxID=7574 RepID=A0A1S3JIT6_LINAN|nr:sarcoplasmic calcium-binding protein 1-like [Lingula anatina]|eukprot:XP_013410325.1 sarcoplasmic calcium-binding protein 1-like [Lingula anatina]